MRFTAITVAALGLVTIASAQSTPPACAAPCLAVAITNAGSCSPTDTACLCNSATVQTAITGCVQSSCSGSDLQSAATYFQNTCLAVGVTPSAAASAASSTGAASSTASASSMMSSMSMASSSMMSSMASSTAAASSSTSAAASSTMSSQGAVSSRLSSLAAGLSSAVSSGTGAAASAVTSAASSATSRGAASNVAIPATGFLAVLSGLIMAL